jgi:spermidine/putrescine transport system substrate-binding protein
MRWLALVFTTTALLWLPACNESKPVLHIYAWGEFFSPQVLNAFEEQYNCYVEIDTFDSNESMFAKLQMGGDGYDLVAPSNYFIGPMSKLGLLQPLDLSLIRNLEELDREILGGAAHPTEWSIPYMLSFTCLAYRGTDEGTAAQSWAIYDDPRFAGRSTLLADPRETIGAALKYLGYSLNSTDPIEIDEATEQVIRWKAHIAKFDSEQYPVGLATGEYKLIHGYSGQMMPLLLQHPDTTLVLPKEGASLSCDHLAILKGAKHPELAHAFINFMLEPKVAAVNMTFVREVAPIPRALDYLDQKTLRNHSFIPSRQFLKASELIQDVGEARTLYQRAWDRIKEANF